MKGQFWIIDPKSTGESMGQKSATGPFDTAQEATDYLLEDCIALYSSTRSGSIAEMQEDEDTWADPVLIVKVVDQLRQCPIVKLSAHIKHVK